MKKLRKIFVPLAVFALILMCFTACGGKSDGDDVSKYTITASVDTDNMTVDATCRIDYVNRTDVELDEVKFHLYPAAYRDGARYSPIPAAEVASAYPNGISYGSVEILNVEGGEYEIVGRDEDILSVKLSDTIMPTQHAFVTVEYKLALPNMRHRFGYCDGTVNLGNWYPVECAYDGGFIETPYYAYGDPFNLPVCDYEVSVTAPVDYTAAMPARAVRSEDGERATTSCKLGNARDLGIVLGKFDKVTVDCDGVDITYYYTHDTRAREHVSTACAALRYFSDKFGDYPYDSYSVVQTPFNQGGMEYTGLVYISDSAQDPMTDEIIVHETAHQWWYGLVGNDQINSAWLDESLAEYSTTLFYKEHPDYGVEYDDRIADAMGGFSLYCELSRCADTSMERCLDDFSSATEYTYVTYVKGQIMYDSLSKMLGEDVLMKGLRKYADKYAYKTATADGLIACLEQVSRRELKSYISSFLDGSAKLYSHG